MPTPEVGCIADMKKAIEAMTDRERKVWHRHPKKDPSARRPDPWREEDGWSINAALDQGTDPMTVWLVALKPTIVPLKKGVVRSTLDRVLSAVGL